MIRNTDNFRSVVKVGAIATLTMLVTPSFAIATNLRSHAVTHPSDFNHNYPLLAQSRRSSLGSLLVELETNIKWGAVDGKWQGRRDSWIQDVRSTNDPVRLGELLTELESSITWDAVEKKWQQRRNSWLQDCGNVGSAAQVGQLLLELESNIKWEAVEGKWRNRRDGWVRDVQRVR